MVTADFVVTTTEGDPVTYKAVRPMTLSNGDLHLTTDSGFPVVVYANGIWESCLIVENLPDEDPYLDQDLEDMAEGGVM